MKEEGVGAGAIIIGLISLLPLLVILVIGFIIYRQFSGSRGPFSFGKTRAKATTESERPITGFADVAGIPAAKSELMEVVQFLREPERFQRLGARVPRGVLMVGPPGTGKTLLAKAVAGEAGVPFFAVSGSEFVEMFVGTGAARVRDLFAKAKEMAPAIVFIDEIDAIGRKRGPGYGGGTDEREQTLNQILVEMDGFDTGASVIVLAATNRSDVLDSALLRPGRFDRQVPVDRPDREGREAILKLHGAGKPLAMDVDLGFVAMVTTGFTGADLANLVNEAAIIAGRTGAQRIHRADMDQAFERVVAGPEHSKKLLTAEERRLVAYHEAGHAVALEYLAHTDPPHKISIVSRGAALGYTMAVPERDKVLRSKESIEEEIAGLLGGRVAEELLTGSFTTGAANDLQRASSLARNMVTQFGMGETLGLRTFVAAQANAWPPVEREHSEETAREIDDEIRRILDTAHAQTQALLEQRWATVSRIAEALLVQESLDRSEIEALMRPASGAPAWVRKFRPAPASGALVAAFSNDTPPPAEGA